MIVISFEFISWWIHQPYQMKYNVKIRSNINYVFFIFHFTRFHIIHAAQPFLAYKVLTLLDLEHFYWKKKMGLKIVSLNDILANILNPHCEAFHKRSIILQDKFLLWVCEIEYVNLCAHTFCLWLILNSNSSYLIPTWQV